MKLVVGSYRFSFFFFSYQSPNVYPKPMTSILLVTTPLCFFPGGDPLGSDRIATSERGVVGWLISVVVTSLWLDIKNMSQCGRKMPSLCTLSSQSTLLMQDSVSVQLRNCNEADAARARSANHS